jgi:hypothetical protein
VRVSGRWSSFILKNWKRVEDLSVPNCSDGAVSSTIDWSLSGTVGIIPGARWPAHFATTKLTRIRG